MVLQVEVPGELENPNVIPRITNDNGNYLFTLEGKRKISKDDTSISNNFYRYYSSIKDGLFSLQISIMKEDITISDIKEPSFTNNENGVLTYYYVGTDNDYDGATEEFEIE